MYTFSQHARILELGYSYHGLIPIAMPNLCINRSACYLIIISQNTKQHFFVETGRTSRRAPTVDGNKYSQLIGT